MIEMPKTTVNADELISTNKYDVDERNPHIVLVDSPSLTEFAKLIKVCPAGLYKLDDGGGIRFDYAGCLECGTCRIACGDTIIEKWENPKSAMGIQYRYG